MANNDTYEVLYQMTKDMMKEVGLTYTKDQLEQVTDFVIGIARLAQEIQKDCILDKLRRTR